MQIGANSDYLEREPERLVLEGYRRWSAGFETGSIAPWEFAWDLYADILGDQDAGVALASLARYVRTLKRCATCPLRSFPYESRHICLDECLTIGLIAGLQHGIDATELCLHHIACPQRCGEVEVAAADFAHTLRALRQVLLPVPSHVLADVLQRSAQTRFH